MTTSEQYNWHGYLLDGRGLPPPRCVAALEGELARADAKTGVKASEYVDSAEMLAIKADVVLEMWRAATRPLIYTGAGISTASGINDYASSRSGVAQPRHEMRLTMANIHALRPTYAHRALTAMERRGLVWGWLQQNHDGLAQKAGFPPHKVNEIHGSWLDSGANPIIAMSGSLRGDLFDWCVDMERGCDFVFAVGTSFSGLNADRCAESCAQRHRKKQQGQGIAVLSLQKTTKDDVAAVRIFSKIDDFFVVLAERAGIAAEIAAEAERVYPYAPTPLPVGVMSEQAWEAERKARRAPPQPQIASAPTPHSPQPKTGATTATAPPTPPQATSTANERTPREEYSPGVAVGNLHELVPAGGDGNAHRWTMFVEPLSASAPIDHVTYHLHGTFSPNVVTIRPSREAPRCELTRLGWGTFVVGVDVTLADGTTCRRLQHELSFSGHGTTTRQALVAA